MTFPAYRNFLNQLLGFSTRRTLNQRRRNKRVHPAAEALEVRILPTATMVKDVDPNFPTVTIGPHHLFNFNGTLFFTQDDGVHGEELWKTDGTIAGTQMVKDINPGPGSSNGFGVNPWFTPLNGILYFTANDGVHGKELWRTDGTEAGTSLIKDIQPGVSVIGPEEILVMNGKLYFEADDFEHGSELWTSDGTAEGTVLVRDINVGNADGVFSGILFRNLTLFNNRLYFSADDGGHGRELWTSDGTETGTTMVIDLRDGALPSIPDHLTVVQDKLYFNALTTANGNELYRTDGTAAGTRIVKDIVPGPGGTGVAQAYGINDTLYFFASDDTHGAELWKTDGTEAGTVMVKDIYAGPGQGWAGQMANFNGILMFSAHDGTKTNLWRSDGTEAGTYLVKDINPNSSGGSPDKFITIGKYFFFQAFELDSGFDLWRTDGTDAGTVRLQALDPNFTATVPVTTDHMAELNGALYFPGQDPWLGTELWRWDDQDQNHAPVLNDSGNPIFPPMNTFSPSNPGMLVSDLIAAMSPKGSITDVDPGAVKGIAVIDADTTHGNWQYSLDSGATWLSIGPLYEGAVRVLAADSKTRIRFLSDKGYLGTPSITFVAWDQTNGKNGQLIDRPGVRGGASAFSEKAETATIAVDFANHAPVLNAGGNPALTVSHGTLNNGTLISDLIATMEPSGSISDIDPDSVKGIAIIGANNANGVWQYSLNNGSTWQPVGTASVNAARLLASNGTTRLRFLPNGSFLGTSGVTFYAWDQTTGNNGASMAINAIGARTAFSSVKETALVEVTGNHAPVINPNGNPTLPMFSASEITSGSTIAELIAKMSPNGSITDEDPGAVQGIAIIGVNNLSGAWQYSLNSGTTWQPVGTTSVTNARLLASNSTTRVRFVPNQPTFGGTVGLTFVAWDQTSGTNGTLIPISDAAGLTPFSLGRENAFVTVSPNHAPVLNANGNPALPGFKNGATNNGVSVSQLIASMGPAGSITDADAGALKGIAIIGVSKLLGRWEYTTDGGANWHSILQASLDNALLLAAKPLNRIRLVPNTGYGGTYTFNFIAWDQTSGVDGTQVSAVINGGSSAFSSTKENATVTVTT